MKLTKNCVKNLTKRILPILCSLLLVFISVFTISCFSPANRVHADAITDTAKKIVDYIKSVSGVINKTVDGIGDIPTSMNNDLTQYVIDNLNGNGVYEDGNGNYVFSNDFLSGFYNILNSNSNIDCFVCGDFSSFNDGVSSQYTDSTYNNNVIFLISSAKNIINDNDYIGYILVSCQTNSNSKYQTGFIVYLIPSDFGFLSVNLKQQNINTYKLSFIDTNIHNVNLKYAYCSCTYNISYGTYTNNIMDFSMGYTSGDINWFSDYGIGIFPCYQDQLYSAFPSYSNVTNPNIGNQTCHYVDIFSSDSLIIAKSNSAGNQYISNNTYIDYFTVNNTTITISKTAIENNNWTNIYNKYVTNVKNEYNQGSDLTRKDVQKIMKKYTDALLKNIADGLEDLEEKIDDTNEWLDKISRQIDEINAYLEEISNNLDNGVGSDGCAWTEEDVTRVKQILERFYLYSDDYLDRLQDIDVNTDNLETDVLAVKDAILALKSSLETWKQKIDYLPGISETVSATDIKVGSMQSTLVTISTALDTIINKINGLGKKVSVPDVDPDVIDDISDLADDKLAELANILSVIGTVLQTTVPFCFLAVLGGVINACSATPECPHWEVDFENNDKSLFGTMELDLSFLELDGLHDAWINLITILFVMGLIVLTFEVFKVFGALT